MRFNPHVLVAERGTTTSSLITTMISGCAADHVESASAVQEAIGRQQYDLFIVDRNLDEYAQSPLSSLELLRYLKVRHPDVDVILVTDHADLESVLEAIHVGVYDYLVKPFSVTHEVTHKIERCLEKRRIVLENQRLITYLMQANSQIENMNRGLEAQVAERTRQLLEVNTRLEQLTLTDDVTGLYNQRFLYARLEEEFQRERRYRQGLAVLMIDIDKFKNVNDTHDHLFGSRVLRRVGHIFKLAIRDTDFAVRYGGDEFALILPHTHLAEGIAVGERLRSAVAEADVGDSDDPWAVTISVGVASFGECEAGTPRELLQSADQALYWAKSKGRNCIAAMNGKQLVAVVNTIVA